MQGYRAFGEVYNALKGLIRVYQGMRTPNLKALQPQVSPTTFLKFLKDASITLNTVSETGTVTHENLIPTFGPQESPEVG